MFRRHANGRSPDRSAIALAKLKAEGTHFFATSLPVSENPITILLAFTYFALARR
jgi:hypothetical protein